MKDEVYLIIMKTENCSMVYGIYSFKQKRNWKKNDNDFGGVRVARNKKGEMRYIFRGD